MTEAVSVPTAGPHRRGGVCPHEGIYRSKAVSVPTAEAEAVSTAEAVSDPTAEAEAVSVPTDDRGGVCPHR